MYADYLTALFRTVYMQLPGALLKTTWALLFENLTILLIALFLINLTRKLWVRRSINRGVIPLLVPGVLLAIAAAILVFAPFLIEPQHLILSIGLLLVMSSIPLLAGRAVGVLLRDVRHIRLYLIIAVSMAAFFYGINAPSLPPIVRKASDRLVKDHEKAPFQEHNRGTVRWSWKDARSILFEKVRSKK
jgi:hypothetical protein